jgi:hypothetical protein
MFIREHTLPNQHVIRFSIRRARLGWEVREEHDGKVVLSINCTDWHRVERRLAHFEAEIRQSTTKL